MELRTVLWTSAAVGALVGAVLQPCMQWSVEVAQVLSGVVEYPDTDLRYIFARKAYSAPVLVPAILLQIGFDDVSIYLLLSAFAGAVSFAGVSACSLVFTRSRLLALTLPFVFFRLAIVGHQYPVLFGAHIENTGVIGLFLALLGISLFLLDRRGPAVFILGVLPCVHGSIAIPAWILIGSFLLLEERSRAAPSKKEFVSFASGLAITVLVVAAYQLFFPVPSRPSADIDSSLVMALVNNWDPHRMPIKSAWMLARALEVDVYMMATAVVLAFSARRAPRPAVVLTRGLAILTVVSFIATLVEQLYADSVPLPLRGLMVRRWLNFNSVVFPILVLGLLAHFALAKRRSAAAIGLIAVLVACSWGVPQPTTTLYAEHYRSVADSGVFPADTRSLSERQYTFTRVSEEDRLLSTFLKRGLVFPAAWLLVILFLTFDPRLERLAGGRLGAITVRVTATSIGLVLAAHLVWRGVEMVKGETLTRFLDYMEFVTRAQTPLLTAIQAGSGYLLVPPNFVQYSQLHTHRTTFFEVGNSDALLGYIPEVIPGAEELLNEIFDASLRAPLPHPMRRVHRVWRSRSREEWRRIGEKYGVTDVIADHHLPLELDEVARDASWILYRIHDTQQLYFERGVRVGDYSTP